MADSIDKFAGENRFLSNFWDAEIEYDGVKYPSTEHAFQAAKTLDLAHRRRIRKAQTPAQAKKLGRQVPLRPNWEQIKDEIMLDLNRQKFKKPHLRKKLIGTGDAQLIEGNTWGDRYWGMCKGVGQNKLGKILMQIRDDARRVSGKKSDLLDWVCDGCGRKIYNRRKPPKRCHALPMRPMGSPWKHVAGKLYDSFQKHGRSFTELADDYWISELVTARLKKLAEENGWEWERSVKSKEGAK